MVLKIYDRIIHYNISPSYSILTTINRLIDKRNSKIDNPESIQNILESINDNKKVNYLFINKKCSTISIKTLN